MSASSQRLVSLLAEQLGIASSCVESWLKNPENSPSRHRRYIAAAVAGPLFKTPADPAFKFVDLFSGIGGFRRAFQSYGGRCLFSCELNHYARLTYRANFGVEAPIHDDIQTLLSRVQADEDEPYHERPEVVLAGFPCQPFSLAGVSKKNSLGRAHGFLDKTQGTLFHDLAELIGHWQPKAFVLENVSHILGHDGGNTIDIIRRTLQDDLEYDVTEVTVDSSWWVPQRRRRVFFVGRHKRTAAITLPRWLTATPDKPERLATVLHPEDGTEAPEEPYTHGREATVDDRYVLSSALWRYLRDYKTKHEAAGNGFGYGLFGAEDVARTLSARYNKDGAEILIKRGDDLRTLPRRLTPRECARLMGFDPLLGKTGPKFRIPVSDAQAYRQFGNAVVVPVVATIAKAVAAALAKRK